MSEYVAVLDLRASLDARKVKMYAVRFLLSHCSALVVAIGKLIL
jgi:hypothetical protein